jgi:hypothetical protein
MRLVISLGLFAGMAFAQGGGAVAPPANPTYKLLRAVSGSKYEQTKAGFHLIDPRSTFYVPDDKKAIVYMEWEGPSGKHTFEAYWRNPEGKVSVISDFKYETQPNEKRYGGYMELLLNPEMQTGMWSMEGRVDGEVLGTHAFQIVSAAKPTIAEDTRAKLSVANLYAKANASTCLVEALDVRGTVLHSGLGFFVQKDALLTAFQTIDGANILRVTTPNGQRVTVQSVLAFHRWQDWAVLPVTGGTPMPISPSPPSIGDRATTLNVDQSGSRSIVDASLIGKSNSPKGGERWKIASSLYAQSVGAPVMNEYGEIVGMMGGISLPGVRNIASTGSTSRFISYPGNLVGTGLILTEFDSAVPVEVVPKTFGAAVEFATLRANGAFTPSFNPRVEVARATLCKGISKGQISTMAMPIDEKFGFATNENVTVFVMWQPQQKDKAMATVRVYGTDNKVLMESPAKKLSFDPYKPFITAWEIPLANLAPEVYRLDVALDGETTWRSYFKVGQ